MQISKQDVLWNYAATFLKIAASVLLLPIMLNMMPTEMVGIWSVFMTITAFSGLLDFGFSPSFTRNVTYVFSGVHFLQKNGFEVVDPNNSTIDYSLLKGILSAMRWMYFRIAFFLFLILSTIGTVYIHSLLKSYNGSHTEVYLSWVILCIINTYNLYTLYYDSLLQGRGLIKRSKQIIILGQLAYLAIASLLLLLGKGLIAVVAAQGVSVIIIRTLSSKSFFDVEMKNNIKAADGGMSKEIIKIILPNALKIGATTLGGFVIQRSSLLIGALYLSLNDIASYGITTQVIAIIVSLSGIYFTTYLPKIVQLRVLNDTIAIKEIYLRGFVFLVGIFLFGGGALLLTGQQILNLIGSNTPLLSSSMLATALLVSLLESNHSQAGVVLVTKNEVPFFKASLLSAALTLILLFFFLNYTDMGIWAMILAPGIAQGIYQNWKWPSVVIVEFAISWNDLLKSISAITNKIKQNQRLI
jgi:O-antigen/teichoic acid export membrane protein